MYIYQGCAFESKIEKNFGFEFESESKFFKKFESRFFKKFESKSLKKFESKLEWNKNTLPAKWRMGKWVSCKNIVQIVFVFLKRAF